MLRRARCRLESGTLGGGELTSFWNVRCSAVISRVGGGGGCEGMEVVDVIKRQPSEGRWNVRSCGLRRRARPR